MILPGPRESERARETDRRDVPPVRTPLALEAVRCPLCGGDAPRPALRMEELSLRSRSRICWSAVRCLVCGLVYVSPRERAGPVSDYEGEAYGFARSHLADLCVDGRPHPARVLDELEGVPPGRLLDVGCATGEFLLAARERGWEAVGVEVSPYAAAAARRRGLQVHSGTLADVPSPATTFDVVTLLDVVEHLEDPLGALRAIHRLLRPGGLVVVETPNWRSIYRVLLRGRWAAFQPRFHLMFFEERTLRRALETSGFRTLRAGTEIVSLLSPEAARRGLGLLWARGVARDFLVRWRLRRPFGPIDRILLRLGPARRAAEGAGSFKRAAESADAASGGADRRWSTAAPALRLLNRPIDRLCLRLGMGEQLRVVARRT
jgi:2-polyprenyl-3-methyl-5-hydroxy-6-metoxy-1,4-benzoquinol methylase